MDRMERLLYYYRIRYWAHAHSPFACLVVWYSGGLFLFDCCLMRVLVLDWLAIFAMISLKCIRRCTSIGSIISSDNF
jgi:hypothetical protein